MATQTKKTPGFNVNIDFSDLQQRIVRQFQGFNPNDPGQWPLLPRVLAYLAAAIVVLFLGWYLLLSDQQDQLDTAAGKELALRTEYSTKLAKAVNLAALKKEREQVLQYVTTLEKQLPGKAEMDALLSDINQAGVGRGLQFDLFKPGSVVVRDYYAELPISVTVKGSYHELGRFASDLANLPRIVTLNDIALDTASKDPKAGATPDNTLSMKATVKTFRYLDPDEIAAQRQATSKTKKQ